MDRETKEHGRLNFSYSSASSDVFEPTSVNDGKLDGVELSISLSNWVWRQGRLNLYGGPKQ
ncbi:hypothetical protein Hanom_Chr08g00722331 [Helianthus anomalus]